jgi:hypothetical protein
MAKQRFDVNTFHVLRQMRALLSNGKHPWLDKGAMSPTKLERDVAEEEWQDRFS